MVQMNGVRVMLYEIGNGPRDFRFGPFFDLFADLAQGFYWAIRNVEFWSVEGEGFPRSEFQKTVLDRDDSQDVMVLAIDSLPRFARWAQSDWDEYYALRKPISAEAMIRFYNADLPPDCPLLIRGIDAARYHVFAENPEILQRIKRTYPRGVYDCALEEEL